MTRRFSLPDSVSPKAKCYWFDLVIECGSASPLSLASLSSPASLISDPSEEAPLDSGLGTEKAVVERESNETTWSPLGT